jgi:glycerophosphoryl diester phosphodiesterase
VRGVEILGHRGCIADRTPENTRAAVEAGLRSGADGVEVDVRLTADGVAVCSHDPDLSREAGVDRLLRELSYAQLGAVRVSGHRIPSLASVVTQVSRRGRLVLDLKPDPEPERLIAAVALALGHAPAGDVVLSSFCPRVLAAAAVALPDLPRAPLLDGPELVSQQIGRAVLRGDAAVHLPVRVLLAAPDLVDNAHRHGLDVRAWTVNRVVDARLLDLIGVDGVITDVPGELRRGLARRPLVGSTD